MVIHHGDPDPPPNLPFFFSFDLPFEGAGGNPPGCRFRYFWAPTFRGEPDPPLGRGTNTRVGSVGSVPPPPPFWYGSAPPPAAQRYRSPFKALVPSAFPPGTDPNVVACFQVADADRSGFIDDKALQRALSSYDQRFSLRTVHLIMYLFTSSNVRRIGPKEFISVFYSLQRWRTIFERFDRDRSGRIDMTGLREALVSLRFDVSPIALDLLVFKFANSRDKNKSIDYDNFIECILTVKGLSEKFEENDKMDTGYATFNFESFTLSVLPFLIA